MGESFPQNVIQSLVGNNYREYYNLAATVGTLLWKEKRVTRCVTVLRKSSWIIHAQGASAKRAMKERPKIPLVETIKAIN